MGILTRFKDIMASNINSIFNNEDKHPEKTIRKFLDQQRSDLGQVKAETAALEVECQRARRVADANHMEQDKMNRYIDKATESGDSQGILTYQRRLDALKAEQGPLDEKVAVLEKQLADLSAMNEKLTSDMSTLESKLSEIEAKLSAAEAQTKLNEAARKSNVGNTDDLFRKMNEKADYMVDRANAMAELERGIGNDTTSYDDVINLASKYDDGDGTIDIK